MNPTLVLSNWEYEEKTKELKQKSVILKYLDWLYQPLGLNFGLFSNIKKKQQKYL